MIANRVIAAPVFFFFALTSNQVICLLASISHDFEPFVRFSLSGLKLVGLHKIIFICCR
ncbi:hypothetical protein T492DRAFT_1032399 [Pavlovales sp. CCMP2436]|nr:hypothetical protein T492DRAFT_1032399 [Pavlovales sp. CCMP2436]